MTIDEFNDTGFGPGMFAIYKDNKYPISAVDFDEALLELKGVVGGADHSSWVRCESVEIIHFEPNPNEAVK